MLAIHKKATLIFIGITIILLSLTGCAKKECKATADCKQKDCFTTNCVKGKCIATPQENCCGNLKCEDKFGENKCSCDKDCGKCAGKQGQFAELMCDTKDECTVGLNQTKVEEKAVTERVTTKGPKFLVSYVYDYPFDLQKSVLKVSIQPEVATDILYKPEISKIQVIEKLGKTSSKGSQEINILGELDVNKPLLSAEHPILEEVMLKPVLSLSANKSEEKMGISVKIYYNYYDTDRSGDPLKKSDSFQKDITEEIVFVITTYSPVCPKNCDDANPCTIDSCSALSSYFCAHKLKLGTCCGNFVCETSETKCNCARDCGDCARDYGTYMAYFCEASSCLVKVKNPELIEKKTLMEEKTLGGFTFLVKTEYKVPFDFRKDSFQVTLEIIEKTDKATSMTINRLQLLDGIDLLGEEYVSETFSEVTESYTFEIQPNFIMKNPEVTLNPTFKMYYELPAQEEGEQPTLQSYSKAFGSMVFVKPDMINTADEE